MAREIHLDYLGLGRADNTGPAATRLLASTYGSTGQQQCRPRNSLHVQGDGMAIREKQAKSAIASRHDMNGGFKNPITESSAHER